MTTVPHPDLRRDDAATPAATATSDEMPPTSADLLLTTRGLAAHSGVHRLLSGLALASLALVALVPAAGAAGAASPAGAGSTVSAYGGSAAPSAPTDVAPAGDAAALRGSIVYLKNNNIWLTNGAGSRTKQVTTDGTASNPYRVPSQSNAGTIAAARGNLIVRLDRTGTSSTPSTRRR